MVWKTVELRDKSCILDFLERDRLYAAYAIGDLEPDFFAQCAWWGAESEGRLGALALRYDGLQPPALFLMGDAHGLGAILARAALPARVYIMCRLEHESLTSEFYAWEQAIPMWRMALAAERFAPRESEVQRLAYEHCSLLQALFALGGGGAFTPQQLAQGVFYGVFVDGELVSVAGTHLVSCAYGVAALGNIFTRPDQRGRGYAGRATSAVVSELLQLGVGDIVLNVSQENIAAQRLYERLGFEQYCPFLEGPACAVRDRVIRRPG
ncbi:MAG: GNAT family N-acetyltransferase [Anaerolineales bacterium]|nr:GNAT family N-acetyltransferase [Anaerolineales bacterium]